METYVADTSVIIEKLISKLVKKKEIDGKILIPKAVVAELENQANTGQEIGLLGLEELQELQDLKKKGQIELEFVGSRPNLQQIKYAKIGGEIDALIMELAYTEEATLITADKVQSESAKAFGVKVMFIQVDKTVKKLEIEKLFDNKTMSVHIKEDCYAYGKKGKPGEWELVKVSDKKFSIEKVQSMAKEIVENTRIDPKSFIEISRRGSTIVQYKNYRVVITRPPVSDGWEITAVKPIKKLSLEEYKLPKAIAERVKEKAHGVIISGQVGEGKSTFAQALAEYYVKNGKITKTVESPRDLQLSDEITQYSKNFTTSEEIHDILFLSRPDNVIFDEMRDTPDFKLYTDLRLGGSNVVGVLHAASPIDSVQRFIGRLETGMIPSVLDTIIFVEKGSIAKVLTLKMVVKVPSGMVEADLSRPVIEVRDFESNKLEFEIYSYGEETVVVPVSKEKTSSIKELAAKSIERFFNKYCDNSKVEIVSDGKVVVYLPEHVIARVIGKQGKNIEEIENKLGISIDVQELKEGQVEKNENLNFEVYEKGKFVLFNIGENYSKGNVDIYVDGNFMFTSIVGKRGEIKFHRKSKIGKALIDALDLKKKIELKTG